MDPEFANKGTEGMESAPGQDRGVSEPVVAHTATSQPPQGILNIIWYWILSIRI